MPYTRRPFNPLVPAPNQVVNELNQANENFDILANAFQGGDPATGVVLNADKVDGFHASLTPAPNVIPVANSSGKLDLGWLPDDIVNRRVDLTNATSDYDLQLGEEAYYVWDTTRSLTLPLRIKVSGMLYKMVIVVPNRVFSFISMSLLPNNLTYSSAFQRTVIFPNVDSSVVSNVKDSRNSILYEQVGGGGMLVSWLQTTKNNKGEIHYMTTQTLGHSYSHHIYGSHRWNDTTNVWSSLGTLNISRANGIIYVSIRRLV